MYIRVTQARIQILASQCAGAKNLIIFSIRLLWFFELWCSFVIVLSTLVEKRVLKKTLGCNFQPSLLEKIPSSLENRILEWEVSGSHNNN